MHGGKTTTGITLAFGSLVLLGMMPVIANSRPDAFEALTFAFSLSVWQIVFSLPLVAFELKGPDRGIFGARLTPRERNRALVVALSTGAMFGLSTYLYVLGVDKAGATNAAIAIQAYPLFAILWESLFLGRHKTRNELFLTTLLVAALYYLGTGGTWKMAELSPWFLIALGVPFLWSIAHVIIKEELTRTPITPAQVTFFRVAISTVFLAMVIVISAPHSFSAGMIPTLLAPIQSAWASSTTSN